MVRITISRILAFRLSSKISLDLFVIKRLKDFEQRLQFLEEVQQKLGAALLRPEIVLEITENEAIEFKKYIDYKIQSLLRASEHVTETTYQDIDDRLKDIAIYEVEELQQFYNRLCKLTENIN